MPFPFSLFRVKNRSLNKLRFVKGLLLIKSYNVLYNQKCNLNLIVFTKLEIPTLKYILDPSANGKVPLQYLQFHFLKSGFGSATNRTAVILGKVFKCRPSRNL